MRLGVRGSICTALLVAGAIVVSSPPVSLLGHTRGRQQAVLAQTPQRDPRKSAVVRSDFRNVLSTALAVFAEQGTPVSYISRERGLIRTASVSVGQSRLRELTTERFRPVVDKLGRNGGRYVLQITVKSVSTMETKVIVESMIVLRIVDSASAVGGQVVPTSMRIETEFLEKLAAKVRTSR